MTTSNPSSRSAIPGTLAPSRQSESSRDRRPDPGVGSSDEPSFDAVFEVESVAVRRGRGDSTVRDVVDDDAARNRETRETRETHGPLASGDETVATPGQRRDDTVEDPANRATAAPENVLRPEPRAPDGPSAVTTGLSGAESEAESTLESATSIDSAPLLDAATQHPATQHPATTGAATATNTATPAAAGAGATDVDNTELMADAVVGQSLPDEALSATPSGSAPDAPDAIGVTGQRSSTSTEQAVLAGAPNNSTSSSTPGSASASPSASTPASTVAADQLRNTELVRRSDLQRLGALTRVGLDITTDELGAIRVEALDRGGSLHVTLSSDDAATRQMLADRTRELRSSLGENLASFDVDQRNDGERRHHETHGRSGENATSTTASASVPTSSTTGPSTGASTEVTSIDGPLDLRL